VTPENSSLTPVCDPENSSLTPVCDPLTPVWTPVCRAVIELKLLRGKLDTVLQTGLEQTLDYCQRVGADEAHLVIFNRNPKVSWSRKIWHKSVHHAGFRIGIWGA
jgi:hypothetical protein